MTLSVGDRVVKLDKATGLPIQAGEMAVEFEVHVITGYGDENIVVLKKIR